MIVVVGGGIAGLACALALSDVADVLVVERRAAVAANAGQGIQLSPNAVKALRAVGAEEAVRDVATAPTGLTIRSAGRSAPVVRVAYEDMETRYGAPYLTASRAALHDALRETAETRPSVAIAFDTRARRVSSAGGRVIVEGVDAAAALVVAADGVRSDLRTALVGDTPQGSGWIAWRGRGRPAGTDTELVMATGHHLVRYALSESEDNCVLIARERGRTPEALARTGSGEHLADVDGWMPWTMRTRPRHVFRAGPVAFAGDAAHAMLPFLAQGGAMALEDAASLRGAVKAHGIGPAALAAYESARRPRTKRVASQADSQGGIYHLPLPLCLARDEVMRRLGPDAVRRRVDWIWRWSPPCG
jgi:salicylate hydroxylase